MIFLQQYFALQSTLKKWNAMKILPPLGSIAVITAILLFIYAAVQQNYRSNANDPQLQMARDISQRLRAGKSLENVYPKDSVDISKSLAVFAVLYDNNERPLKTSAFLDGHIPQLPKGVFEFTRLHGEDVITWQPWKGVRIAMVVISVQSPGAGYIAVGRSLKEVEIRENNLVLMGLLCWLICTGIVVVSEIIQYWLDKIKTAKTS
jgi:hypothetical protein